MINAEFSAVENAAGARLTALRLKEVTYYSDRFNSVGTQCTLILGFVVGLLTVFRPLEYNVETKIQSANSYCYVLSASAALVFALHTVLSSTFVGIWGTGMALRGPDGSVQKSYKVMKYENRTLMFYFLAALFFFVIQVSFTYVSIDAKELGPGRYICAIIIFIGFLWSVWNLRKMERKMQYHESTDFCGLKNTIHTLSQQ